MSNVEDTLISRHSGFTIMAFGAAVAVVGVLPLLLYVELGPVDGNPIGLGLLAMLAAPGGAVVAAVGLTKLVVQCFVRSTA